MSEGLYDDDGIDGPFERAMNRAMLEDSIRGRQPSVRLKFARAAAFYAAACEGILRLSREALAIGECQQPERQLAIEHYLGAPLNGPALRCVDRFADHETGAHLTWFQAHPGEIEECCETCRARVAIWEKRYRLRQKLGGLKRAMLMHYRRLQEETACGR